MDVRRHVLGEEAVALTLPRGAAVRVGADVHSGRSPFLVLDESTPVKVRWGSEEEPGVGKATDLARVRVRVRVGLGLGLGLGLGWG